MDKNDKKIVGLKGKSKSVTEIDHRAKGKIKYVRREGDKVLIDLKGLGKLVIRKN